MLHTGHLTIIKIQGGQKLIHKCKTILTKIPTRFFGETRQVYTKVYILKIYMQE